MRADGFHHIPNPLPYENCPLQPCPGFAPGGELDRLFGALAGHGFSFQVNGEFAGQVTELTGRLFAPEQLYCGPGEIDDEVRVLISYGGDGTFLEAVRVLDLRPIPMIGINSGRLGFLANITMEGLDAALCDIRDGNYAVEERTRFRPKATSSTGPVILMRLTR